MSKISEAISRIRGQVKAEVQDAFVTDRYIYSLIEKYAQVLMRRQDYANKLMKFNSVWKTLPYIELIDVDKVEAHCAGITSGCTIKRSKKKLPSMFEGYSNTYCKFYRRIKRTSSYTAGYFYFYD